MSYLCEWSCGRLKVGEDGRQFQLLGHVISCGGGAESAVRDRISCAWSKWRELVSRE